MLPCTGIRNVSAYSLKSRAVATCRSSQFTCVTRGLRTCDTRSYSVSAETTEDPAGDIKEVKNVTKIEGANLRKQFLVSELNKALSSSKMIAVLQHHSLTVEEMFAFRLALKEKDMSLTIVKNNLTRRALEGTRYSEISNLFRSTTCVVYSETPAVKELTDLLKKKKKMILLGVHVDNMTLEVDMVKEYIKLPSLEQQRSQILSLINQPAQLLASLLTRGPQELVSLLQRHADEATKDDTTKDEATKDEATKPTE
eukprot:CFRG5245T1